MFRALTRTHCHGARGTVTCSSLILVICWCLFCCAQPVRAGISTTGDVQPANPDTWTANTYSYIGNSGNGTLNIAGGGVVSSSHEGYIGHGVGSIGQVAVDGPGSIWTNGNRLYVGDEGSGTLDITSGGAVINTTSYVGRSFGSTGVVTVDGPGSTWTNSDDEDDDDYVCIGYEGSGMLNITNGGLVSIAETLTIDASNERQSFVNMASGGMLALSGEADESLFDFLGLINGTDAIRYWDDSISDWADITGATYGQDYTLSYLTEGDLAGYTTLTVTAVPEPTTLALLLLGLLVLGSVAMIRRRRRVKKLVRQSSSLKTWC